MGMHKGFTHGAASAPNEEKRFTHGPAKPQQFLREYIEQKQAGLVGETKQQPKKKLTFEEWYNDNLPVMPESKKDLRFLVETIWKIAQENV